MKRRETISLDTVKTALRRHSGGHIENRSGYCVFVDASGDRFYVVEEATGAPVPYAALSHIAARPGTDPRQQSPSVTG